MGGMKIIRTVGVQFSENVNQAAGLVHADLYINDKKTLSATGVNDAFVLQNLLTAMEAEGYSEDDRWAVRDLWRIELGEDPEDLPEEDPFKGWPKV